MKGLVLMELFINEDNTYVFESLYYYDLKKAIEVRFEEKESHLFSGLLSEKLMDDDEKHFQELWKTYFKSIAIQERLNPKLHRQNMPARFWDYMPEKQ